MKRSLLPLFILVLYCGSPAGADPVADSFKKEFNQLHSDGIFNGNLLVAKNGKVLLLSSQGIADYRDGRKLNEQTVFNLASVSKPFTATAILLLIQKGKLSMDSPLAGLLPQFRAMPGKWQDIQIKHLLSHTSGLPDYEELADDYFEESEQESPSKFINNSQIISMLVDLKPELSFDPGTDYEYSNTGYLLLASVVEKVSGQSFEAFLKSNIFAPAGMQSTVLCTAERQIPNRAIGFGRSEDEPYLDDVEYLDGVYGDGNLCSNVTDLLKFDQAWRNGLVLNQEWSELAETPATLDDGTELEYGMGWEVADNLAYHTGSWTGFRTYFIRDRSEGYTIIVLDNSSNDELYDQVDRLIEDL